MTTGEVQPEQAGRRVLVVEDDRLARRALRSILEWDGYRVCEVGTGVRAIHVMTTFDPQVVVMDWRLPGLFGEQLFEAIHRIKPDVPVIIVSGSDEAFSSRVEVAARLRKPLDVRRLRAALCTSSPPAPPAPPARGARAR